MSFEKVTLFLLFLTLLLGQTANLLILRFLEIDLLFNLYDLVFAFIFLQSLFLRKYRRLSIDVILIIFGILNFSLILFNTKYLFGFDSFFYLFRFIFYLGSYPFFIYVFKKYDYLSFVRNLAFFTVVFYLFLFYLFPNLSIGGFDPHVGRLYGPFFDPNFYSIYLLSFLILLFFKKSNFKKFDFVLSILLLISIYLTYSRVGLMSLIFVSFLFFMKNKNYKFLTLLLGFLLLVFTNIKYLFRIFFVEGNLDSFFNRVFSYIDGLIILENNILAVGFNNIKSYKYFLTSNLNMSSSYTDSFLLNLLITGGIFNLFLILGLLYFLFFKNKKGAEVYLILLVLIVSSFIFNAFFHPYFLFIVLLISSLDYTRLHQSSSNFSK